MAGFKSEYPAGINRNPQVITWATLDAGYWIGLLLAVPAAGFLVRLFMIQHDCGHGSFFRHRLANDWVGRVIGVLTLTPYGFWRRAHALHHASSGNLDRRGIGDIDTLTVREFLALSKGGQLLYRLYRHPIVMFGVGPAYLFIFRHRLPMGLTRRGWQPWLSAMATNVAIAVLLATMVSLFGLGPFLLVQLPITLLATSIGVWLFYVQHQFEDTFWARDDGWNRHEAALQGSSHYDLPNVLRWFTANIGVRHVHHLCSRIPYYRLPQVLKDHPQLSSIGRLTLVRSKAFAVYARPFGMRIGIGLFRFARLRLHRNGFELRITVSASPVPRRLRNGNSATARRSDEFLADFTFRQKDARATIAANAGQRLMAPGNRSPGFAACWCDPLGALLRRAARIDQVEGRIDEPDM